MAMRQALQIYLYMYVYAHQLPYTCVAKEQRKYMKQQQW